MLSEKHNYKNVLWGFAQERKLLIKGAGKSLWIKILLEIDLEGII